MAEQTFQLVSNYQPTGDQPQAIARLVEGVERGDRCQTLLGVTGSGKTFTMANVIAKCNRPTLVLAHNKTLAAQLCTEFRSFFPENAVEYFVSYYDYYQPEAYIPSTDTYIGGGVLHLLAGRPHRLPQHGHQSPPRHGAGAGRALPAAGQPAI